MLGACAQRPRAHVFDVPVCAGPPATDRSGLAAAPTIVARAVAGVCVRGEQDEMLKLEAKLPGFGGSYIGSLGQVVVYMKPDSPASPELVLVPGWSGYGTSLVLNRVKVGFRDAASVCPGVAAITSMGIPTDAIIPEIWGEMRIG